MSKTEQIRKNMICGSVETITVAEAANILERNTHNRPLKPVNITYFSKQMEAGNWELNGEPIIIASNGDVMDGQHRLWAVIECEIPLTTVVIRGVARSTFHTLDTGSARTGSDVLAINGYAPDAARMMAAAAKSCIVFEHYNNGKIHQSTKNKYLSSPALVAEWAESHPLLEDTATRILSYGRKGRPISGGALCFLYYQMRLKEDDMTHSFFDSFITGANLEIDSPILVVRNKLFSVKQSTFKWSIRQQMGATIRAWSWYLKGRSVAHPANLYAAAASENSFKLLCHYE